MANSLEFHYIDSAKKKSIDKAVAVVDALKDVSILAYDDTEIKASLADVSAFAHGIQIPENVSELVNDKNYLVSNDVSNLVTKDELESKGYLTDHQSLEEYALNINVNTSLNNLEVELKNDVSTAVSTINQTISTLSTETDVKFSNTENLIDQKVQALGNDLSATIESNKTTAATNLEYAIERVRADYDASILTLSNSKQDKLTAGNGISIENGTISAVIDNTLFLIVDELPVTDIDDNKIYLISTHNSATGNVYTEHLHTQNGWEKLGEFKADADLSGYYRKGEVDANISEAVTGVNETIAATVAELNLADSSIDGKVTNLATRVNNLDASLSGAIESQAGSISSMQSSIDGLVVNQTSLDGSINTIDVRLTNLETKESSDYTNLNNLVYDQSITINRMDASVAAAVSAVDGFGSSISDINAVLTSVDGSIGVIKTGIQGLDSSIDALDASVKQHKDLLAAQGELFDTVLTDIENLKQNVTGISKFGIKVVDELPEATDASINTIYLLKEVDEPGDMYSEYIVVENIWEKLGIQKFVIEDYATIDYVDSSITNMQSHFVDADAQATINSDHGSAIANLQDSVQTLANAVASQGQDVSTFQESLTIVQQVSNNAEAVANDVSTRLAEFDVPSIEGLASQDDVDASIAAIEDEISGKVDKEINGTNGKAVIFNESDGGGAKFIHNDGTESFVGVNDGGENGLVAQIYADKYIDNKWQGAKIDVTHGGIYYTVGSDSFVDRAVTANEIATKGDISTAISEIPAQDLTDYALMSDVSTAIANIPAPDLSDYVTKEEIGELGDAVEGSKPHPEYWTYNGEILFTDPTYEEVESFEVISDENSWNDSYANGILKEYYTKNPDEDLLSTDPETPDKTATFNDRIYVGTIDDSETVVRFKAGWLAKAQSITNVDDPTEVYYMERLDKESQYYGTEEEWKAQYSRFHGKSWTLYTDADLTQEAGKVFNITTLEFDGFDHSYNAWIANGAQTPWICVNFMNEDTDAKIVFRYEGKDDVKPWNDTIFGNGEGHKAWGIASLPQELGDDATDVSKLQIFLEHQGVEYFEAQDEDIEPVPHTVKSYTDAKYADLLEKYNALLARVEALENKE